MYMLIVNYLSTNQAGLQYKILPLNIQLCECKTGGLKTANLPKTFRMSQKASEQKKSDRV